MAEIDTNIDVSISVIVIGVGAALALPIADLIRKLAVMGRKSAPLLRSNRISDHWKERILPTYAMTMLRASLLIFASIMLLFLILTLGLHRDAWLFSAEFKWRSVRQGADYILVSFVVALVYLFARRFVRHV